MITIKQHGRHHHPTLPFVALASAAATLAAALSTDVVESPSTATDGSVVGTIAAADDDDDGLPPYLIPHNHEGNSTLSATFSIRVTPEHYHAISWTVLWLGFFASVLLGIHQTNLERRWLKQAAATASLASSQHSQSLSTLTAAQRRKQPPQRLASDPELGGAARKTYARSGGRLVRSKGGAGSSRDKMTISPSASSNSINKGNSPGNDEGTGISSGDLARATVSFVCL